MITKKSNIEYEIIVNEKEKDQLRDMYYKNGYQYGGHCESIVYRPDSIRWSIYFTTNQYKLFKRLWNEIKNKK